MLCGYPVPPPWDINFGDGTVRHGRCASNRKNTAGGTSGSCSAPPKVLMHSQLRKTAFASGPRVQRAPGVPHALSQEGGNAEDDGAPAPQTMGAMTHVWRSHARHSGARPALAGREPGIPTWEAQIALGHVGIPGSRLPPSASRAPRNDENKARRCSDTPVMPHSGIANPTGFS